MHLYLSHDELKSRFGISALNTIFLKNKTILFGNLQLVNWHPNGAHLVPLRLHPYLTHLMPMW